MLTCSRNRGAGKRYYKPEEGKGGVGGPHTRYSEQESALRFDLELEIGAGRKFLYNFIIISCSFCNEWQRLVFLDGNKSTTASLRSFTVTCSLTVTFFYSKLLRKVY